jgi:hypothetical protein
MTTIPATANFSPAERAYFESAGAVHPETGAAADNTPAPEKIVAEEKPVETPVPKEEAATEDAKSEAEAEDGDEDDGEEVVKVVNAEGEETTRRMVHYGALKKERMAKNKAREQIDQMGKQMAYLTGALEQMRGGKAPAADTPAQPQISTTPPDYKTKPEEWLNWVNQTVAHAATFTQQQGEQTQQQRQQNELYNAVAQHEQSFISGDPAAGVEAHPDFMDAVQFVRARHTAELKEAGYEPAEIQQILTARAHDLAIRALRAGKNPAERLYAVAKQHGYKKAAPKAEPEPEAVRIARQAEGQAKAKTISNLSGGAEKGLSMEVLANTPMSEFQKLFKAGKPHELMGIPRD